MGSKLTEYLNEPRATVNVADLLAWCDEQNRSRLAGMMDRWYFVTEKDGRPLIDTLNGTDGEYARMIAGGRDIPDFVGWPRKRMDGYRNWLRGIVSKGMIRQREAA